jgi:hypothetical protein
MSQWISASKAPLCSCKPFLRQPSLQSLPRGLQKDVHVLRLQESTNPVPLGRPHATLGHVQCN